MMANLSDQIRELIDNGARPISESEIVTRRPVTGARPDPVAGRRKHRPRWGAAVAASVAAAAAAAITVALVGGGTGREPAGQHSTVLTAAMVRKVATASGTALAQAGHLWITYSIVDSWGGREAGTEDLTFNHKNWNDAIARTSSPKFWAVNRYVDGRLYYHGPGFERHRGDPLHWYRETNPIVIRNRGTESAPDPRRLLQFLAPAARFVRAGHQVIDGVRVEHLRATRLTHLSGLNALNDGGPIGRVTSLDVWVDDHGVIRLMHLTSQKSITMHSRKKFYVPGKNGKRTVKFGSRIFVRHGIERQSARVSFLDIGHPPTITAPAHSIPIHASE
jgi:hypothetical protein